MNGCVIVLTSILAVSSPTNSSDTGVDSKTRAYIKADQIISMVQSVQNMYGGEPLNPPIATRLRTVDGTKFTVHMTTSDVMKLPCTDVPQRQEPQRQEPRRP